MNDIRLTEKHLMFVNFYVVQLQYGGCAFPETGSSFILAVDWGISSKFGKRMDIHPLKRPPLRNLNPEVDFRFYGRHLEKSIWRHKSAEGSSILTKFGRPMQNETPMTKIRQKSKSEIEFQYGSRPFSEIGSSFISAMD